MKLARVLLDGRAYEARVEGEELVTTWGQRIPMEAAVLLPPTEPSKVICVGFNYRDHAQELQVEIPQEPLFFLKPPSALVAHGQPVVYPPHTRQLDYEGELAVVIGRRCRNVRPEEAREVILGYSIFNDVTARDVQKVEKQWVRAKAFDGSAPYGPWVETELDPSDVRITTRVKRRSPPGLPDPLHDLRRLHPGGGSLPLHDPGARRRDRHRDPTRGRARAPRRRGGDHRGGDRDPVQPGHGGAARGHPAGTLRGRKREILAARHAATHPARVPSTPTTPIAALRS
jgi:2-keto-4-pentenoate hydratase/2-oxohepta-3-ene-1,7-dioic acid hydratase in catechol pathway